MSLDVALKVTKPVAVYEANITHNLGLMAEEAGLYQALWEPETLKIKTAKQLLKSLRAGLALLKSDPAYYKQFNAKNGWGKYENLVSFVEQYIQACEQNPEAAVSVDR